MSECREGVVSECKEGVVSECRESVLIIPYQVIFIYLNIFE